MRLLALGIFFVILFPAPSRAWTEAEIDTLSARIDVSEDASIHVRMTVRLHVRGGWLERLEIAGLDEAYVLDEETVAFRGEGSPRYPRVVRRDDGRLQFNFERRAAPRRGHYDVSFEYTASVASTARPEGDVVRYDWTLPGWRTGLDGVEIELHGPRGLHFAASEDVLATIDRERSEDDDSTTLSWSRAHLPRTVPWTVGFTFGSTSPVVSAELEEAPEAATDQPADRPSYPLAWFSLLSLLSLLAFSGRAQRYGAVSRPLVPLPLTFRAGTFAALGGAAFVATPEWFAPAAIGIIALLGVERTPKAPSAPSLGAWRALGSTARLPVAHRPWDTLFDGTSILGLITLAAVLVLGLSTQPWGVWTLVLTLPWLTGTGRQLPMDLATKRERLLAFAGRAPAGPYALGLALHESADGHGQDVRLRVATKFRCQGLVRFDVVCAERPGPGGLYVIERILVVAREGSRAHELATKYFTKDKGHPTPGGRTIWATNVEDLVALSARFGTRPKKKRRRQRSPKAAATPRRAQSA